MSESGPSPDHSPGSIDDFRARWALIKASVLVGITVILLGTGWFLWGANALPVVQQILPAVPKTVEIKGNASSMSMSAKSSYTRLHARTVALFTLSDSPLANELAKALTEQLRSSSRFQQVTSLSPADEWKPGTPLPDLFVRLRLDDLEFQDGASSGTLTGKLACSFGDKLVSSNVINSGQDSPPGTPFRQVINRDLSISWSGMLPGPDRDAEVSKALAKEINKDLAKSLEKLTSEQGAWTAPMAPEFMPAAIPAPDWAFLKDLNARMLISGPTVMASNQTWWSITPDEPVADVLERIYKELKPDVTPQEIEHARKSEHFGLAHSGGAVEVFEKDTGRSPKSGSPEIIVHFRKGMSPEEKTQALNRMLDRKASLEELLPFAGSWNSAHDRIAERLEAEPSLDPTVIQFLLHRAKQQSDQPRVKQLLQHQIASQWITQKKAPDNTQKKEAKEAGIDPLPSMPPFEWLLPGSYVDLRIPGETVVPLPQSAPVICLIPEDGSNSANQAEGKPDKAPQEPQIRVFLLGPVTGTADEGTSVTLTNQTVSFKLHGHIWSNTTTTFRAGKPMNLQELVEWGHNPLPQGSQITLLPPAEGTQTGRLQIVIPGSAKPAEAHDQ